MDNLADSLLQGLKEEATEIKIATNKVCAEVFRDLHTNYPQLMDVELQKLNDIKFTIFLGHGESKAWKKYHSQVEDDILKEIYSSIEKVLNRAVATRELKEYLWIECKDKNNELKGIFHVPKQKIDEIRQMSDDFQAKSMKEMRNQLIQTVNDRAHHIGQPVLPDIHITLIFPTSSTINVLNYQREAGVERDNCIYSLPSVTLDTNVFLNMKRGETVDLLEFRQKYPVDLAVTHRIQEDLDLRPCEDQFLTDSYIRKIPSIMRCCFDSRSKRFLFNPEFDKPGSTEFLKAAKSIIDDFFKQTGENPPEYQDWDHLHAHYLSGRDIFLTEDKKILKIKGRLKELLDIVVMKLEEFLRLEKCQVSIWRENSENPQILQIPIETEERE